MCCNYCWKRESPLQSDRRGSYQSFFLAGADYPRGAGREGDNRHATSIVSRFIVTNHITVSQLPQLVTCNDSGYTCYVIRSFRHKGLARFFERGSKKGISPNHAERLRILLGRLDSAQRVEDLAFPGADLHLLKGSRTGLWALRVSGNWRLTFRYQDGDTHEVDYEDYH